MSVAALPVRAFGGAWPRHLFALALATSALLLLFHRDLARLTMLWWTSTTFGHCLFIGPVIAWLVWQRRAELSRLDPVAWWPGLAIVALGGFGWLLGAAGSVAFARELGMLLTLEGAVVTLLGPQVARGLAFPLGYAIFLVPFGEGIEAPLQTITVAEVMPLLHLAGVPASSDGVLIAAGGHLFEVAEACSGAKFVLAMFAFAVLVCNQCFVSWRRRAVFLIVALAVPVLANGLRAFATIYAACLTSVEAATGFDHIVYGWLFFAGVMAAVIALAWRWFDRAPDTPAFDPAALDAPVPARAPLWTAAAATVAVAAAFVAWDGAVAARTVAIAPPAAPPAPPGWHRVAEGRETAWHPSYPGADRLLDARYADADDTPVQLAAALYASQGEGRELVGFGIGVLREGDRWVRVADLPPIAGGSVVRIAAPGGAQRVVATWYVVGGVVTADPRRVKIETARARLLGGDPRAAAIHLSAGVKPGHDPAAAIARFAATIGPADALARRLTGSSR